MAVMATNDELNPQRTALLKRLRTPAGKWRVDELVKLPSLQDFPDMEAEDAVAAAGGLRMSGDTVDLIGQPIMLTADLSVYDGNQRRQWVLARGAKYLTANSVVIDTVSGEAAEDAAWDRNWHKRQLSGEDKARAIRKRMRRRGWSQGQIADSLRISQQAVSKLLGAYPAGPSEEPLPDLRVGKDGRMINTANIGKDSEPEEDIEPPKAKRIREHAASGQKVVQEVNRWVAELTNPALPQWVLDHADEADREGIALKLDGIIAVLDGMAASLRASNEPGSRGSF